MPMMADPTKSFPLLTRETVKRRCAGAADSAIEEPDFEACADHDGGHLYHNGCCVHCFMPAPEERGR